MTTTLEELRDALQRRGYRSQIVDVGDAETPTNGLSVWMGDQTARYADDTIWPPVGNDGWVWGDRFQEHQPADIDIDVLAERIIDTVRTRS